MKVRTGFVSNSSSMSFIIDLNAYTDVLDLAEHVLTLMIPADEKEYGKDDEVTEGHRKNLERVRELRSLGVDPNIPYDIPMLEEFTRMVKREDGFYFQTVYAYEDIIDDLPGILENVETLIHLDGSFVYMDQHDLIVRMAFRDDPTAPCGKPEHEGKSRMDFVELFRVNGFARSVGWLTPRTCALRRILKNTRVWTSLSLMNGKNDDAVQSTARLKSNLTIINRV